MCMILELLGRRRVVLVSPYASASMILVAKAVVEALRHHDRIVLVDGGGFRPEVLENLGGEEILGRVEVRRGVPGRSGPVAAYNAGFMLSHIPPERLVVASVLRRGDVPRGLRRDIAVLQRVSGSLYLLRWGGRACLVEITAMGVAPAGPRGREARALSLLSRAVAEYGPLSVRDAVDVLARGLGLDRRVARRLLVSLAQKKLVSVEGGSVLVEYGVL